MSEWHSGREAPIQEGWGRPIQKGQRSCSVAPAHSSLMSICLVGIGTQDLREHSRDLLRAALACVTAQAPMESSGRSRPISRAETGATGSGLWGPCGASLGRVQVGLVKWKIPPPALGLSPPTYL